MAKGTHFSDLPVEPDDERRHEVLGFRGTETGWFVTAIRMPYYDSTLEFVQVCHPDGQSSYFTGLGEGFRAGPFGGGYSWACPKYVVAGARALMQEAFGEKEVMIG